MSRPIKTRYMQYVHAKRRAQERYDLWIDEKVYFDMVEEIQQKKAEFLGRESNTRTHWLVRDIYIVVYDSSRQSIATFLPPDAIWNYLPRGAFKPLSQTESDY